MLKLKLMKYILLCPSDIYSMIQSLLTGMSKNIVGPYQKSFLHCNMDRIYFKTTQNTCFDSRPIGFCKVLLKAQLA